MSSMNHFRSVMMILLILCGLAGPQWAATLTVGSSADSDFWNLEDAIGHAEDGDVVVAEPGTYASRRNRDLGFQGKVITVRSADGPETCIIDCQGDGPAFRFACERPETVLQGFTITNGRDTDGSALQIEGSSPMIVDCWFVNNNAAEDGGAVRIRGSSDVRFHNCRFIANEADDDGGAVADQGSGMLYMVGCTFGDNQARDNGGAIFSRYGTLHLSGCRFLGNVARSNGAALYNRENAPFIVNSAFSGNYAHDYGGGLYNRQTTAAPGLLNCTFSLNEAGLEGGAICSASGQDGATLSGCILWNNRDISGNGFTGQIQGAPAEAVYSCVQGWRFSGNEAGMLDADPLFVDPEGPDSEPGTEDDNLQLAPASPCIDAGGLTVLSAPVERDVHGKQRLRGPAVDMGAHEYEPEDANGVSNPASETLAEIIAAAEAPVIISEVFSHSGGAPDWVELYNCTDEPVSIAGWFLSDDPREPAKYEIQPGMTVDPRGYVLLYQDVHFDNPSNPGSRAGFGFAAEGEAISLCSGLGGVQTGYVETHMLPAAPTRVSLGRYQNSLGTIDFALTQENTPAAENAPARVGPVIISEIMYHPDSEDQRDEYVELWNISDSAVTLYDDGMNRPWRLWSNSVYDFPSDPPVTLPSGGRLLVARDPEALALVYGSSLPNVPILGPYDLALPDDGGVIEVRMSEATSRAYPILDRVEYNSIGANAGCALNWLSYWPGAANGQGASLERIDAHRMGNEPLNWGPASPTPGF